MIKFIKSNIHILILLILGFVLRFTISFTHSYSSDELSAINRLNIDGFGNIIESAVKTGDMHPAGVQLFEEFWVSLFGGSELALRFPFVIMGVFSIWLTYLIGKNYLNKNSGLIASLLLTITYFPILQSELARPYSPGLLFSLLVAWFWLKLILKKESNIWQTAVGLGFSFALAMYTHYFAFMFVGFIGITGLFFLKKESILPYLTAGLIGVVLFLPHIEVTLYHLSIDGGLQWLAKPEKTWLFQFLFHAFNESYIFISTISIITIYIFFVQRPKSFLKNKPNFIFTIWFFGIYIIAYLFSYFSSPILKFPVMLFPLPFLFLSIGSLFSQVKPKLLNLVFGLILIVGTFSTLIEKDLYGNKHFGVFKELAEPIVEWRKEYGKTNTPIYFNLSNPNYLNYYVTKLNDSLEFEQDIIEFDGDKLIREKLSKSKTDYLIIGYSQRLTLPQVFETCKAFYPVIIDYKKLNNCAVFLLAKEGKSISSPKVTFLSEFNPEKNKIKGWRFNQSKLEGAFYKTDSTNIYGPDFIFKLSDIKVKYKYYIRVKVVGELSGSAQLTATITAKRTENDVCNQFGEKIWIGKNLELMMTNNSQNSGYFNFSLPKEIKPEDNIMISLWNRNGTPIKLKSIEIEVVENIWN